MATVIAMTIGKLPISSVRIGFRDLRWVQSIYAHLDTEPPSVSFLPSLQQMTVVIRLALKFRLLAIRFTSEEFETGRGMRRMGMFNS